MDHRRLLAGAPAPFALSDIAAPPPPPGNFRPGVAVVVGVLTSVFSLTFLLLLYAKHCKRAEEGDDGGNGGAGGGYDHGGERRRSGVDRAVVESLPVFRFAALKGEKEGLECAVCLGRFEPAEALRLLPKCRHGFHVECVDTWLDAHSTCPLCRSRVDPEDILLLPELRQEPPPAPAKKDVDLEIQIKESKELGEAEPPVHRISGRHSTGSFLLPASLRPNRRRSVGGRGRKDRVLMAPETATEREAFERRFSHQIIVGDGGEEEAPARNEMLFLQCGNIANSARVSVSRAAALARFSCSAAMPGSNARCSDAGAGRCNSEITGVSRFPPAAAAPSAAVAPPQ